MYDRSMLMTLYSSLYLIMQNYNGTSDFFTELAQRMTMKHDNDQNFA